MTSSAIPEWLSSPTTGPCKRSRRRCQRASTGSTQSPARTPASNSWSDIAVAVIDTGSGPHADLNIAGGKNCSVGKSFADGNGHGTHVAGTIGAINNGAGVVGVAPGIPIYSVRVLNNQGSGSWSSVICGIDWVTANAANLNIKVANMSLGGGGSDDGNCGTATRTLCTRRSADRSPPA